VLSVSVSPVVGLDSVDIVLLVRASTIDQVSALLTALRRVRTGDAGLEPTLGGVLPFQPSTGRPRAWPDEGLVQRTATLVGLQLDQNGELVGPADPTACVAGRALIFPRCRFDAGMMAEARAMLRSVHGYDGVPLRVLGHSDAFPDADLRPGPLHAGAFLDRVRGLTGRGVPFPGVATTTELAVATGLTPADLHTGPSAAFATELARLLAEGRTHHLGDRGWARRWRDGAKRAHLPFRLTDGVLTLICTTLAYLEDDPEGFLSIVPGLAPMLDWAESFGEDGGAADPGEPEPLQRFADYYVLLQEQVASRGRRDHPLRLPGTHLAFEGHAGYRVARDAFDAFIHHALAQLNPAPQPTGPRRHVVVIDSPAGRPQNTAGPGGMTLIRTSALAVHHPILWGGSLHELAEGWLRNPQFLPPRNPWDPVADAAFEVRADLALHALLRTEGSDESTVSRRFWFLYGPMLIFAIHDVVGVRRLDFHAQCVLLARLLLVETLLGSCSRGWTPHVRSLPAFFRGEDCPCVALTRERIAHLPESMRPSAEALEGLDRVLLAARYSTDAVHPQLDDAFDQARSIPSAPASSELARLARYYDDVAANAREPWPRFIEHYGELPDDAAARELFLVRRGGVCIGDVGARGDYHLRTVELLTELEASGASLRLRRLSEFLGSTK
jgi:hypothetical protein